MMNINLGDLMRFEVREFRLTSFSWSVLEINDKLIIDPSTVHNQLTIKLRSSGLEKYK